MRVNALVITQAKTSTVLAVTIGRMIFVIVGYTKNLDKKKGRRENLLPF